MRTLLFLLIVSIVSCGTPVNKDPLETVLSSNNVKIKRVMDSFEKHEVQILYTEVTRNIDNSINFVDYNFQVDDSIYFYPASSVKFPVALLALEKMYEENQFKSDSKFYVEGDSLESTFEKEVEKIFAVSDNEAYNRLFEYLGKDDINNRLKEKGLTARISHRLSTNNPEELTTKPFVFYVNDSTTTTTSEIINSPIEYLKFVDVKKGIGYIEEDRLINEPKDFSRKNYFPITSLHNTMKQWMFPELYPKNKQFNLLEKDRHLLLNVMRRLPRELGYDTEKYHDSYVKFFMYGDTKSNIPNHIKIYNKVGYAHGYLTDCAYIINEKTDKEYIITATIHVNENGIFNDDIYEYESVGIPFLAELGRQLVLK